MSIELVIVSIGCIVSFINLLSTIFLSNAVFRLLTTNRFEQNQERISSQKDVGLVDLPEIPTYDPRFLSSKKP